VNQVARKEPEPAVIQQTEAAAFVSLIERAARDPAVDMDKLERLLAMRERQEMRAAEQAFAEAMTKAQAEMRAVATDANNPQTRSRYASYMALDKATRPIYTRHGFALSFNTDVGPTPDILIVGCSVLHSAGYTRHYSVPMPADGKGAKGGDVMTKTHATGAAMTYGQRYLLKMIFNIAVGEDTDGNGAGGAITEQQGERLKALIVEAGADIGKFLAWAGAESISDIPASRFAAAVRMLEAKRNAKQ
jgi:hypothetical protein